MGTNYPEVGLPESYPLKIKDNTYGMPGDTDQNYCSGNAFNGLNSGTDTVTESFKKKRNGNQVNWRIVWYDFSQRTTLHGVNRITEANPFPVRR